VRSIKGSSREYKMLICRNYCFDKLSNACEGSWQVDL
jgi:hypothetical protein